MIETKLYTLPLTGQVLNWRAFSGDPEDPVRVVGPLEALATFAFPEGVPPEGRGVSVRLRSIDVETGTAVAEVEAHPSFHAVLARHLKGRTPRQIAEGYGRRHLRRSSTDPKPETRLELN